MKLNSEGGTIEFAIPMDCNCRVTSDQGVRLMLKHYLGPYSFVLMFDPAVRNAVDVNARFEIDDMYYKHASYSEERHRKSGPLQAIYITPGTTSGTILSSGQAMAQAAKICPASSAALDYEIGQVEVVGEALRSMRAIEMPLFIDEINPDGTSNLPFAEEILDKITGIKMALNVSTLAGAKMIIHRALRKDRIYGCVSASVLDPRVGEGAELIRCIAGGGERFFFGSRSSLPNSSGEADFSPVQVVLPLLAHYFDQVYPTDGSFTTWRLEDFMTKNGPKFLGVSVLDGVGYSTSHTHVHPQIWDVPDFIDGMVPVGAGETIGYQYGWTD